MRTFLAIDFGTSQTSVAMLKEKMQYEPEIPDIDGQKAIPTAVRVDAAGNPTCFGKEAMEKLYNEDGHTFYNFKPFIGTDKVFEYAGKNYTAEDLAIFFLEYLRGKIEKRYFNGANLSHQTDVSCVVGCPAEWSDSQKNKVEELVSRVGFPNVTHCDEPIGVIYFYHFRGDLDLSRTQNILVYDFGGGTTDVAVERVHAISEKRFEPDIIASGGSDIGGMNFDEVIASSFIKKLELDPAASAEDRQEIERCAKELKEVLSFNDPAHKSIPLIRSIKQFGVDMSMERAEFQTLCSGLIEAFYAPLYSVLNKSGLDTQDIDRVILAGGSSAIPYVREKIAAVFPNEKILMSGSPTEVVVKGLAIYGRVRALGAEPYVRSQEKSEQVRRQHSNNVGDYAQSTNTSPEPQKSSNALLWVIIGILVIVILYFVLRGPEERIIEVVKEPEPGVLDYVWDGVTWPFRKIGDWIWGK